jgi:hypothetical protein
MLSKEQIESTLRDLYRREEWKTLLSGLFTSDGAKIKWELKPTEIALGTKTSAYRGKNLFRLGTIELTDGKQINIYEAEVQNTRIAENRVGLRSLMQSEIIPGFNDAALAVFHSSEQTEWRFTFMSKWEYPEDSGKVVKHETHPKKFTYVLGPTESCRTAKDRFYELQTKEKKLESVIDAFSVSKLSKDFFEEYKVHYKAFNDYLKDSPYRKSVFNIPKHRDAVENEKAEKPIRDFVKRLLGRIVFLYFLQKKGWLKSIWAEAEEIQSDHIFMKHLLQFADKKKDFYTTYLVPLFFETLNKKRKNDLFIADGTILGEIPYLNGGLFEKDFEKVESIEFKNKLFQELFGFFDSYNFTIIEDSPDEREVAVDPEMLGHIFENLIEENKKFGTFYTPKEVVYFMTQEVLLLYLSKNLSIELNTEQGNSLRKFVQYKQHDNFISSIAPKINTLLDSVKVCDPAIGSGAFPMGILLEIFLMKSFLNAILQLGDFKASEVKERIIRNSIYGVDIDKGAIDIARLRFWLSLVVDLDKPRELPNFDYKFMQGDSLKEEFEGIPLKIKEEKSQARNENLFGEVNEPESFYGFLNRNNINIEKLEEDLFDAHDDKLKEDTKKKLDKTEKAYIKLCIDDRLGELKTRIDNEWKDFRKRTGGLLTKQRETLKTSYQKRVDKLETAKEEFEEKANKLKNLEVYEKPYFLWHLYFKHVFDNGGFDIVIANPPYGVDVDDELYASSELKNKDSYGFFIKLAIEILLKPNATLVYIVSDTWLTIGSHLQLRKIVLKNKLQKVIRLHQDTFGAVVNTCIFSLTKTDILKESKVIAADLTNLSIKKSLPEFREKLYHLEKFIEEFNEKYAIYYYNQQLIHTNSNLPIFTSSPKLFLLMNDSNKVQVNINDKPSVGYQVKFNAKECIFFKLGDSYNKIGKEKEWKNEGLFKIVSGIKTGNNKKYLGATDKLSDSTLQKATAVNILSEHEIEMLSPAEKEDGINAKKCWISFEMGQPSDTTDGYLPCYYQEHSGIVINWSKKCVTEMKSESHSDLANKEFRFEKLDNQISFSTTGMYAPTLRIPSGQIFLNKASRVILRKDYNQSHFLGILNSRILRYLLKNFSNHSVELGVEDLKMVLIPENVAPLNLIVDKILEKQKEHFSYDYLQNEQKEIDQIVYEAYGLNEDDIQEVENWWARRYPKLARFADTKPRLSVKDVQELQARLKETIARGENKYCEFKSSLSYDLQKKGIPAKTLEHAAFKNIAAFLNSEGGTLIIGVDDAKNILGLEQTDYTTFSKPDKQDEWSKHLDNLIQNYLGNKFHEYLKIHHVLIEEKTIAVVEVKSSAEAVWLNNGANQEFYIRRTASAAQLTPKEATEYILSHWKK